MLKKHCVWFVGSLALGGTMTASVSPALAAESAPAVAPAPSPGELQGNSSWRRYAIPAALAGSGLALAGGIGFGMVARGKIDEFNSDSACNLESPGKGGPHCAAADDKSRSARRWMMVGLGLTPVLAATALVLWLTKPSDQAPVLATTPRPPAAFNIACAPGLGAQASCTLTF